MRLRSIVILFGLLSVAPFLFAGTIFGAYNAGQWSFRTMASSGPPNIGPFTFGSATWEPVTGDWAASGHSGIGVFDPTTATWYLRNNASAGAPDIAPFVFGGPNWLPITGDWTGSGHSDIGVFDPATATWYLRSSLSAGAPDFVFQFGDPGSIPVTGVIGMVAVPEPAAFGLLMLGLVAMLPTLRLDGNAR